MKRIIIIAAIFCLSPLISHSMTVVDSGSVTRANMRLSTVNGTAFVDFSAADVLTDYIGYKLKICSVTNAAECIEGYIKAAGTGETLGSEMVTGGDFSSDGCGTTWTCGLGWTQDSGDSNVAAFDAVAGTEMYQTGNAVVGTLYKFTYTITGVLVGYTLQINSPGAAQWAGLNSAGAKTYYLLAGVAYTRHSLSATGGMVFTVDDFSRKAVLTPSSTGVTIVSEPSGTTYNWASNEFSTASSFNDTAGYSYEIYPAVNTTISGNDNTLSYGLIDCNDTPGLAGINITGTGNTIQNYTIVRCPGGGIFADEDITLKNTIVVSAGADITIAATKTVSGTTNLFGDAAKAGDGTYTDVAGTLWNSDPVFANSSGGIFKLSPTSPAIYTGTDVSLTEDYDGKPIRGATPNIGAYESWPGIF